MTFLPLVERELRAAVRRTATRRVRWWSACFAILLGLAFLGIVAVAGAGRTGQVLFRILTGFSLLLCLLSGVLLTADCLSREKRDGTLGLLFLTDLRGYDVVLGKFVASSISAFYALLALLPVTAVSLLLGAVTGDEFWRTALALVNALFISLTAGIWVSALGYDSRNTMGATLVLILALVGVLPAATFFSNAPLPGPWNQLPWIALISPLTPFQYAAESFFSSGSETFWTSLLVSHSLGWLFLGSASWLLPRRFQQDPTRGATQNLWQRWLLGNKRPLKWSTRKASLWLESNPVFWLLGHEPALSRLAWIVVAVWAVLVISLALFRSTEFTQILYSAKAFGLVLKLLVAIQAARFFSEARRTGVLEMLLSTPLRNKDILRGQWLALRRIFFWPLCAYTFANLAPITIHVVRNLLADDPRFLDAMGASVFGLGGVAWITLTLVADVAAAGWFGMWLGLTTKKPHLAPALNVLFVLVLPAPGAFCGLDLVVDFILILWSTTRLYEDFRWLLARQYSRPASAPRTWPTVVTGPIPPRLPSQ